MNDYTANEIEIKNGGELVEKVLFATKALCQPKSNLAP